MIKRLYILLMIIQKDIILQSNKDKSIKIMDFTIKIIFE